MQGQDRRADSSMRESRTAALRELIRQQRRVALEARTIAITLQSALHDADTADPPLTVDERIRLRRQWCERAQLLAQDVRAHAARSAALAEHVARGFSAADGPRSLSQLALVSEAAEQALDTVDASVSAALAERRAG